MGLFKIGVILDSFKTDIRTAVLKAVEIGADGFQVYTTNGPMSPEELTAAMQIINGTGLRPAKIYASDPLGYREVAT